MAIERTDHSIAYAIAPPGATAFGFPFSAGDAADIHVFDHDPSLPEDDPARATEIPPSGFAVAPNPSGLDSGGSVTLALPLPAGHRLEIRRATPVTQGMVLHNQAQIPPKSLERAIDKLTRIDQEQAGRLGALAGDADGLRAALADERAGRDAADAALNAAIQAEAAARRDADNVLRSGADDLANAKADKTALQGEAAARTNADAALRSAVDAETAARTTADAALHAAVNAKAGAAHVDAELAKKADRAATYTKTEIDSALGGRMPKAPDDGKIYVGSGGTWTPLSLSMGDPFAPDEDGDAVAVERPSYLPNAVWDIRPEELVLSGAAKPGDMDNMFAVDADGDAVLA